MLRILFEMDKIGYSFLTSITLTGFANKCKASVNCWNLFFTDATVTVYNTNPYVKRMFGNYSWVWHAVTNINGVNCVFHSL